MLKASTREHLCEGQNTCSAHPTLQKRCNMTTVLLHLGTRQHTPLSTVCLLVQAQHCNTRKCRVGVQSGCAVHHCSIPYHTPLILWSLPVPCSWKHQGKHWFSENLSFGSEIWTWIWKPENANMRTVSPIHPFQNPSFSPRVKINCILSSKHYARMHYCLIALSCYQCKLTPRCIHCL